MAPAPRSPPTLAALGLLLASAGRDAPDAPAAVQCLVVPSPLGVRRRSRAARAPPPLGVRRAAPRRLRRRGTALPLFFDRFYHPYGIDGDGDDDDDDVAGESSIELLDALLPRLPTAEERSRWTELFQRARLDEQLRYSRRRSRPGEGGADAGGRGGSDSEGGIGGSDGGEGGEFLSDDDDEVSRMANLFQRARLTEQLRLSSGANRTHDHREDSEGDVASFRDKAEAFQRALLEERLKFRQLQRHRLSTADSIERAMMEFEDEAAEERKALRTLTMVQEGEEAEEMDDADEEKMNDAADDVLEEGEDVDRIATVSTLRADGVDGSAISPAGDLMPVNQTDCDPSQVLDEKIDHLRRMVANATSAPATTTPANRRAASSFMSTTHLPLPPREDAPFLSLALAPFAHLATSVVLVGAAGFYALLAVLDVIFNDDRGELSARACLKEASSVVPECAEYVFGRDARGSAATRTMRALRTSCVATFYAVKCILLRAARHSKWSSECADALTGSLRYLVYAARSVHVLWTRAADSAVESFRNRGRWDPRGVAIPAPATRERGKLQRLARRMNPHRALSTARDTTAERFRRERSLRDEQKRLRSEGAHDEKLRLLNLDRLALERDRKELEEAQRRLEYERKKLLVEGVNVLAWYCAAREEAAAAATMEQADEPRDQGRKKKGHWNFWRGSRDQ